MQPSEDRIDTIVIGGSAGSFTALKTILPHLPPDVPAAMLVCQHIPVFGGSRAVDLLAPHSRIPLVSAEDGMEVKAGQVIFAPPDVHLMLGERHVHLRRGAHENNFRPAIDPLFRSAAVFRGPRAVGVILSGLLDDGAAGARALDETGGVVLAQSPETSEHPSMPAAALAAAPGAEAVALEDLAGRLVELAGSPCDAPGPVPWRIGVELKISGLEGASISNEDKLGKLSPYNCPNCNGVLWEIEDGPMTRFRCHTGHGYTMDSLSAAQEEALDKGLFDALRAHKGRALLMRRMVKKTAGATSRRLMEQRVQRIEEDAARLEDIIRSRRA